MKNEISIEKILWMSISDIEKGEAKTFEEDPINGLLKNKKLNKMNVCLQSQKYNGSPISRPTLDKFLDICEYIDSQKETNEKKILDILAENKRLQSELKEERDFSKKIAQENYRLNELLKNRRS